MRQVRSDDFLEKSVPGVNGTFGAEASDTSICYIQGPKQQHDHQQSHP